MINVEHYELTAWIFIGVMSILGIEIFRLLKDYLY